MRADRAKKEKYIYMSQIQGEWAIIGALGIVLFIVVIGKKMQMLLNFMIRVVFGVLCIAGGYAAGYVAALFQYIVYFETERRLVPFQE